MQGLAFLSFNKYLYKEDFFKNINFNESELPLDCIYLDIDYMEDFKNGAIRLPL